MLFCQRGGLHTPETHELHYNQAQITKASTTVLFFYKTNYESSITDLVGEVVAVHLVTVGLPSRTLNIYAMALQDGCFFKNTQTTIADQLTKYEQKTNEVFWVAHKPILKILPMFARRFKSLRRLANQLYTFKDVTLSRSDIFFPVTHTFW